MTEYSGTNPIIFCHSGREERYIFQTKVANDTVFCDNFFYQIKTRENLCPAALHTVTYMHFRSEESSPNQ
jgi:hypothetical protein